MTFNVHNAELSTVRLYEAESSPEIISERYGLARETIIDFSLNVNPFGPPPKAVEAATGASEQIHLYPDLNYTALRCALAKRHDIDEDTLFFGAGLDDVIKLILQAWTSEGDTVVVHLPTFPRYELEARLRGCTVVGVTDIRPAEIDLAGLEAAFAAYRPALSFLCTPNNPTGARIGSNDIARFAALFPETVFVIDEALINPSEHGSVELAASYRNVVVLRTFSKYFGIAGMRVGYAVADPALVRLADVGRPPFNIALPSLEAARAALDDLEFLACCKAIFESEHARFLDDIAEWPDLRVCGRNANMILLDLGHRNSAVVTEKLARRGILVADATSFRGLEDRSMLRISLRGRMENERLIEALKECL